MERRHLRLRNRKEERGKRMEENNRRRINSRAERAGEYKARRINECAACESLEIKLCAACRRCGM